MNPLHLPDFIFWPAIIYGIGIALFLFLAAAHAAYTEAEITWETWFNASVWPWIVLIILPGTGLGCIVRLAVKRWETFRNDKAK